LVGHPQIRAGVKKEVHYFDRNFHRSLSWYRAHFPVALTGRRSWLTLDASPFYVFHPLVPERLASILPNAKLILLLRDPVSRAYSHYQMTRRQGFEPLSFEAAVEVEEERLSDEYERLRIEPLLDSEVLRRQSYLARGRYAEQLERLYRHFPRDQVGVFTTENLRTDPSRVHSELLEFLGLDQVPLLPTENRNVGHYEPLSKHTAERLKRYFAPHNQRLYELLGRDLGWESSAEASRSTKQLAKEQAMCGSGGVRR